MTSDEHIGVGGAAHRALDTARRLRDVVRRAFAEFLGVPTAMITAFFLLAVVALALDRATPGWMMPAHRFLQRHVFIDSGTTSDVLAAIAAGIITVTSITFSVLLLAVQQASSSMSNAVLDQFLRRRHNQVSFGFFCGLALYTLVILASVHERSNAVIGATLALALTVVALYALLVLLYSTVDQMRPSAVLGSIKQLALDARERQSSLLARTRRRPLFAPEAGDGTAVRARASGFVTRIDLARIEPCADPPGEELEILLLVSVGAFVSLGDEIARVRRGPAGAGAGDDAAIADAVLRAVRIEFDRDIAADAAYGVDQLHAVGWTSISSAKSSPGPGMFAIRMIRDLMARWLASDEPSAGARADSPRVLPVVYEDTTIERLFDALESLGVAASESKQHHCLAEVLVTLAEMAPRFSTAHRARAAAVVERLLPSVRTHLRTSVLDAALSRLATRLDAAGEIATADAVRRVRDAREERAPAR